MDFASTAEEGKSYGLAVVWEDVGRVSVGQGEFLSPQDLNPFLSPKS